MKQEQIYEYIKQGQNDKALQALFDNIENNPQEIENYINAGILIAEAGEIEHAETFFQKALTIDAENGAVYYNLANVYYNEGRLNEAIKLYQTALQHAKDGLVDKIDANYMIGMSFNQLESFKQAMPFFMTAAEADDRNDIEVQFQYGLVLCHLEMYEQAIEQLNYLLTLDKEHVDGLYNLGLATYMSTENVDDALYYFNKAISINPEHHMSQHAIATFKSIQEEE